MRLSRLAKILEESVPKIPNPEEKLEQYTTPAELALKVALVAIEEGGKIIADLGAGTCRMAIAALLLGASKAIAIEYDRRLSKLCLDAAKSLGVSNRLLYVISRIATEEGPLKEVDVIITNPPFGVRKRGADKEFLLYAMNTKTPIIIAIVKSGNLYFHKHIALEKGYGLRLLWSEAFPIPALMPKHRSRIRRVKVDVIELKKLRCSRD